MAVTTLFRRILSRTRTNDETEQVRWQDNTITQPFLGLSSIPVPDQPIRHDSTELVHRRRSRADVDMTSKSRRSASLTRVRNHERSASYDSIREQSDIPQSFTKSTRSTDTPCDTRRTVGGDKWIDVFFGTYKAPSATGRRKSNSFSHLPHLFKLDTQETLPAIEDDVPTQPHPQQRPVSPFEALPLEILEKILWLVRDSPPENEYTSRTKDLASCSRVARSLNQAAVGILYKNVSVPHSMAFSKFMSSVTKDPEMATLTKRLDFSHYNNIGFGRTRQGSAEIMNVTPTTLQQCLAMMPKLQEFLVHEHLDDELSHEVLTMLFSMPTLEALDFCASSSECFTQAFTDTMRTLSALDKFSGSLKRLSLHECTTLQSPIYETLLRQLPRLTHLDVAHTLITDDALFAIPREARLTHLNLGRCTRITGPGVARFLSTHPAVKDSLVFLNLMAEPSKYRLLREGEVTMLLRRLPNTLRSLNIGGARINKSHMPLLRPLTNHLEELGLSGADLSIDDLNGLLLDDRDRNHSSVRYLDLSNIDSVTQASLHFSKQSLLSTRTLPLEVIELSESVLEQLKKRKTSNGRPEWVVRELGRRGWYVRQPVVENSGTADDGRRSWKMGARWWGMRKLPVAEMDVGGMYGFYAFKRI